MSEVIHLNPALASLQEELNGLRTCAWHSDPNCIKNPVTGKLLPVLANVLIALRSDPELKDKINYDEMQRAPVWERQRPATDADITKVQEYLQHAGISRISKDTVHQAVDCYAREHSYHPVRDYLNALNWDGVARLDTWLASRMRAYTLCQQYRPHVPDQHGGAHLCAWLQG
jgi:hypothetical protein